MKYDFTVWRTREPTYPPVDCSNSLRYSKQSKHMASNTPRNPCKKCLNCIQLRSKNDKEFLSDTF